MNKTDPKKVKYLIRPIQHHYAEYAVGHCKFWPSINVEVISCTYNVSGFTPMNAVVSELGLDRSYFEQEQIRRAHQQPKFFIAAHRFSNQIVITTSKTKTWNEVPAATEQIIKKAESMGFKSLCLTHFAFIVGKFPEEALAHCMRQVAAIRNDSSLNRVVIDVDACCWKMAENVYDMTKSVLN